MTGQSSQTYCYTHNVDKNNIELEYTQQGGSCVPKPWDRISLNDIGGPASGGAVLI